MANRSKNNNDKGNGANPNPKNTEKATKTVEEKVIEGVEINKKSSFRVVDAIILLAVLASFVFNIVSVNKTNQRNDMQDLRLESLEKAVNALQNPEEVEPLYLQMYTYSTKGLPSTSTSFVTHSNPDTLNTLIEAKLGSRDVLKEVFPPVNMR